MRGVPPCSRMDAGWTVSVWGCGPSAGASRESPGCGKLGFLSWAPDLGTVCRSIMGHLLTVSAGRPQGHSPGGFKMASMFRCCCRGEEEKGREGAAAQPPGLPCVGRLPLPVCCEWSAAAAVAALAAASGCRRSGMPITAGPGEVTSGTATSPCPAGSLQPALPRLGTALVAVNTGNWTPGLGTQSSCPVPCPHPKGFADPNRPVPLGIQDSLWARPDGSGTPLPRQAGRSQGTVSGSALCSLRSLS